MFSKLSDSLPYINSSRTWKDKKDKLSQIYTACSIFWLHTFMNVQGFLFTYSHKYTDSSRIHAHCIFLFYSTSGNLLPCIFRQEKNTWLPQFQIPSVHAVQNTLTQLSKQSLLIQFKKHSSVNMQIIKTRQNMQFKALRSCPNLQK